MVKITLSLIILFLFTDEIISQKTDVELILGYQQHDKRFFGHSTEYGEKEEIWGTSYWGLRINRSITQPGKFQLLAGLGIARETNTYQTPYNHCFDNPNGPCTYNLAWIDRYSVDLITTSIAARYDLTDKFSFNLDMIIQTNFHKEVIGYGRTADFILGLYSIELIPELEYQIDRFYISCGYRLSQLKPIDKIYIYGNNFLSKNPGYLNKRFDTFNPTKFVFTVGYKLKQ